MFRLELSLKKITTIFCIFPQDLYGGALGDCLQLARSVSPHAWLRALKDRRALTKEIGFDAEQLERLQTLSDEMYNISTELGNYRRRINDSTGNFPIVTRGNIKAFEETIAPKTIGFKIVTPKFSVVYSSDTGYNAELIKEYADTD